MNRRQGIGIRVLGGAENRVEQLDGLERLAQQRNAADGGRAAANPVFHRAADEDEWNVRAGHHRVAGKVEARSRAEIDVEHEAMRGAGRHGRRGIPRAQPNVRTLYPTRCNSLSSDWRTPASSSTTAIVLFLESMKQRSSTLAKPPMVSGVSARLGSGLNWRALYVRAPGGVLLASARNLLVRCHMHAIRWQFTDERRMKRAARFPRAMGIATRLAYAHGKTSGVADGAAARAGRTLATADRRSNVRLPVADQVTS